MKRLRRRGKQRWKTDTLMFPTFFPRLQRRSPRRDTDDRFCLRCHLIGMISYRNGPFDILCHLVGMLVYRTAENMRPSMGHVRTTQTRDEKNLSFLSFHSKIVTKPLKVALQDERNFAP